MVEHSTILCYFQPPSCAEHPKQKYIFYTFCLYSANAFLRIIETSDSSRTECNEATPDCPVDDRAFFVPAIEAKIRPVSVCQARAQFVSIASFRVTIGHADAYGWGKVHG
jgi:hypothetical protein